VKKNMKIIVCNVIVWCVLGMYAVSAYALTPSQFLTSVGQMELRTSVLEVKTKETATGATKWGDKQGLREEWSIMLAETKKMQSAVIAFAPAPSPAVTPPPPTITPPAVLPPASPPPAQTPLPSVSVVVPLPPVVPVTPVVILQDRSAPLAQTSPIPAPPPVQSPPPQSPPAQRPPASSAPGGLVPCGFDFDRSGQVKDPVANLPITDPRVEECRFGHFLIGINKVINFLLMITGSIAALVFAYAGFLVLTAGANEGQVTQAKGMAWSVVKGFALMLAAWLLVKLVLVGLGIQPGFSRLEGIQ
jgi:hypothetical protein